MWFAALGSYQHNPWLLNLVVRLLQGHPEVLALMDEERWPGWGAVHRLNPVDP